MLGHVGSRCPSAAGDFPKKPVASVARGSGGELCWGRDAHHQRVVIFIINEKKLPTSYCRSASKSLPKSPRCFTRLVRAERQRNPQEAPLISRNNSALVKLISGEY